MVGLGLICVWNHCSSFFEAGNGVDHWVNRFISLDCIHRRIFLGLFGCGMIGFGYMLIIYDLVKSSLFFLFSFLCVDKFLVLYVANFHNHFSIL